MITEPTTFVIGAGASVPFGLPTGIGLLNAMANDVDKTKKCFDHFSGYDKKIRTDNAEQFAKILKTSGTRSIDTFLEYRPDLAKIGKLSIAAHLLPLENSAIDNRDSQTDWVAWLFDHMRCKLEDFHRNNARFVIFNYDRILELFFSYSLAAISDAPLNLCWQEVNKLNIVHVYGTLSSPPRFGGYQRGITTFEDPRDCFAAAEGIQVIPEERANVGDPFEIAEKWISDSSNVIFLGFGYDETNCERLGLNGHKWNAATPNFVGGSGYGLLTREQDLAMERVQKWKSWQIRTGSPRNYVTLGHPNYDCLSFLRDQVTIK